MPIDQDLLLQRASDLEPLPPTAAKLAQLLGSGDYEMPEIVRLIQFDPALTIRFLKVANSAIYRGQSEVGTVEQAILRLGAIEAVSILMVFGVQKKLERPVQSFGLSEGELWRHSVSSAVVAEKLGQFAQVPIPPEAFTAALIHDIGKLLLGEFITFEDLDLLQKAWQQGELNPVEAESQVLGVHHGEVGGVIAQNWNFPEAIVKSIIYHHHPNEVMDPLTDSVYLSNLLSKMVADPNANLAECLSGSEEVLDRLALSTESFPNLIEISRKRYTDLLALYGS